MTPKEKQAVELLRKLKAVAHYGDLPIVDEATLHEVRDFLANYDNHQKEQKRVSRYADAADANYHDAYGSRGEEFDLDDREWLTVSATDAKGAWVSAWIWVSDQSVREWRKDRKLAEKIEKPCTCDGNDDSVDTCERHGKANP